MNKKTKNKFNRILNAKSEHESEVFMENMKIERKGFDLYCGLNAEMMTIDEELLNNPDTHGADAYFVNYFVNNEMIDDFPVIANTFYKHHPEALDDKDVNVNDILSTEQPIRFTIATYTMRNILHYASKEDIFAQKLIIFLYKTYYPKEYKVLKKFSSITSKDISWLCVNFNGNEYDNYTEFVSITLTMCRIMKIKIDAETSYMYHMINKLYEEYMDIKGNEEYPDPTKEDYETLGAELKNIFNVSAYSDISFKGLRKYEKFLTDICKLNGYDDDYMTKNIMDGQNGNYFHSLVDSLYVLKKRYPDKEWTKEELYIYCMIFALANKLLTQVAEVEEYVRLLLGDADEYDRESCRFDIQKLYDYCGVNVEKYPDCKDDEKRSENPVKNNETFEEDECFMNQILELREKLHKKEYDNHRLFELYNNAKKKLSEYESIEEKYRTEHDELIALREYVYNETEDDIRISEKTKQEYIDSIKDRRIIIVGGHDHWTRQMKSLFPEWKFVNYKSTTTIDSNIAINAEYVFFFSDFIKHNVYYKFINIVRDKQIPFGYISSSNIEKCIKQMAEEIISRI